MVLAGTKEAVIIMTQQTKLRHGIDKIFTVHTSTYKWQDQTGYRRQDDRERQSHSPSDAHNVC